MSCSVQMRSGSAADRDLYQLISAVEREFRQPPGHPGCTSWADFQARLAGSHGLEERCWIASEAGQVIGAGWLTLRDAAEFRGTGKFTLDVAAGHRRRGVGSALLEHIRVWSGAHDVRTLYAWASVSSAGAGFLAAQLDRLRGEEVWSFLDLAALDASAVAARAESTPDPALSLMCWAGPCPAELLADYASCHREIGATARGSSAGSELVDAALLARLEAADSGSWLTVAAVGPAGGLAGFSQLSLPEEPGGAAHQDFTGVVPGWRGRGLAGWLKACLLVRLRSTAPGVRWLITENGAEKTPILAANQRLGFQPYARWTAWEQTLSS